MARPRKPDLSPAELQAIEGKGDRVACGIVSEMRGANVGSISQREASTRRVSHEWVAQQRKRQKTQPSENQVGAGDGTPSENNGAMGDTGSRVDPVWSAGETVWGRALLGGHVHSFANGSCRCGAKQTFGNENVEPNGKETPGESVTGPKVESGQSGRVA